MTVSLASRLTSLNGKKLAFLDCGKRGGEPCSLRDSIELESREPPVALITPSGKLAIWICEMASDSRRYQEFKMIETPDPTVGLSNDEIQDRVQNLSPRVLETLTGRRRIT